MEQTAQNEDQRETGMTEHEGCRRAFHHIGTSWYAKTVLPCGEIVDRINLGFYAYDGVTSGEFEINWLVLGGELTPRLTAYDDSWHALNECRDLLEAMAARDSERISPLELCELLKSLGFEDITNREAPNQGKLWLRAKT